MDHDIDGEHDTVNGVTVTRLVPGVVGGLAGGVVFDRAVNCT